MTVAKKFPWGWTDIAVMKKIWRLWGDEDEVKLS
jgi:hypothetical protein